MNNYITEKVCKFCNDKFIIKNAHQRFCSEECNKLHTKEKNHKIYLNNKKEILEYRKEHYQKNKEVVRRGNKEWILKHPEKMKQYNKKYYDKPETKEKRRIKLKKKYYNDEKYKLMVNLRTRIKMALKHDVKNGQSLELIGCSIQQLKEHLERQFKPGMNWKNYNFKGWHIDHIIPISSFDLSKKEEQKKCFHYTNLQPLWFYENFEKGDKI